jgi:hypothetical protein
MFSTSGTMLNCGTDSATLRQGCGANLQLG